MIEITNEDNMELMARYEDNYFDLAIVDPPYGIGEKGHCRTRKKHNYKVKHIAKNWDDEIPTKEYFEQLFRVSKNQIIWGANYMTEFIPPSMGWVFWDKKIGGDFSDGELAFTSFNRALKIVIKWNGNNGIPRIHPTQKPEYLYKWLLENYATKGDKILDTHLGGGSIAIACHDYKFDLTACEIDTDYFNAALKRLKIAQSQTKLF